MVYESKKLSVTGKPQDFTSQAVHLRKLIRAPNSCRHYENFPVRLSVWYHIAYRISESFSFQIILPLETGKEQNDLTWFGLFNLQTQDCLAIPESTIRSLISHMWAD